MSGYFILDGHEVVPATSNEWFLQKVVGGGPNGSWRVGQYSGHTFSVSTVFVGVDFGLEVPKTFETAIWIDDDPFAQYVHYATWEEAEAGHAKAVAMFGDKP